MGKPGPKPKPTTLRVLEGDPKKLRYNLNEPRSGSLDSTEIPARVTESPDALELWHRIARRLSNLGIAQDVDVTALEMLCVTYGSWCTKPTPQLFTKVMNGLAEFGCTPSSRTRLVGNLPHEDKVDPIAAKLASL